MRDVKFDSTKPGYETDDIKYAFNYNGLKDKLPLIDVIVAEVCGSNDEYAWYWILKMKDGKYAWATGSCDYTGWDCQSSASICEGFTEITDAVFDLFTKHSDSRPNIKECLLAQIEERLPFAIYQEDKIIN